MSAVFRLIGNALSPSGPRARLAILIYHRALPAPDPILHDEIDAATLDAHMTVLAAEFNVLPLGEASERLTRGALPARAAAITFDDGYADNESIALPILKRHGLTATFFVSTGFSRGGTMFNDAVIESVRRAPSGSYDLASLGLAAVRLDTPASRREAIDSVLGKIKYMPARERNGAVERLVHMLRMDFPDDLMMRPEQIRHLSDQGMEIGGHTITHPILASLEEGEARAEIAGCKGSLEDITGRPVTLFAYPNGRPGRDYGPRDVELVRQAGFRAAVSTAPGSAQRGSDLYQLPRFNPWERNPRRLAMRLLVSAVQ